MVSFLVFVFRLVVFVSFIVFDSFLRVFLFLLCQSNGTLTTMNDPPKSNRSFEIPSSGALGRLLDVVVCGLGLAAALHIVVGCAAGDAGIS